MDVTCRAGCIFVVWKVKVRQQLRHASIHGIVRCRSVDGQQGVTAKHTLAEDHVELHVETLMLTLGHHPEDGVHVLVIMCEVGYPVVLVGRQ